MTLREDSVHEENKVQHAVQNLESKGESLVCRSEADCEQTLTSNVRSSGAASSGRELFVPNTHGFLSSVPKHTITSDEKYVLRCLELIRDYALRAEAWTLTSKAPILPNELTMVRLAKECPLVAGTNEIVNSLHRITDSQSMMNILKSPLLRQFGSLDFDANSQTADLRDASEPDFGHKLVATLSDKSPKETTIVNSKQVSGPAHRRLVSVSSTNSSFSDQSSSSASANSFQGMLRCTWINGLPRHVFSIDDKREVYVADLFKVELSDDKALDYVYSFRSGKFHEKELDTQGPAMDSMAVMRVSTSISFCPDNLEVRETRFVLSVSNDDTNRKLQFKRSTRRSHQQKSFFRFLGSSAISEDTPWDPSNDVHDRIDRLDNITERSYATNGELAAIIVKEVSKNCRESDTGGWGLKFLKRRSDVPLEGSTNKCSTSMDILIPAGPHGGPKAKSTRPSSLIERWLSGGQCDCGGWDMGCPLTILSTQSSSLDALSHTDNSGQCKSVNLFIKGSKLDVPMLKMANIHEGLFYTHFQSSLSTLQSFAIAAAIIHSCSPSLRL